MAEAISIFFKDDEREKVKKTIDGDYDQGTIKPISMDVVKIFMRDITFNDLLTMLFNFCFMLLKHSKHDRLVSNGPLSS